ncbi:NUDIX domain-containing protein [Aeromicrobium sp. 50.2.37]|uniref:NUDIX hydrolase n=1 Tax=Aeromicrobium sp. 50.2.37 TaxID=2969305 RepID=UPI00214FC8F0|nr:NUDIX domain-containing protein [Aeromicrobium sp. 50.2.37]MCR4514611.1 NUDIX domain-containing protein [Aeromicrobium sp. 50.2.37]
MSGLAPSPPDRPVIEVVAALVTGPDGRTLLVRKRGTSLFMNPGGKPEPGESHVTALCRELAEELGLVVAAGDLVRLDTIRTAAANEPGHDLVAHCFTLRLADPRHAAAAEIEEARWVDPADPDVALAPLASDHLLPWLVRGL